MKIYEEMSTETNEEHSDAFFDEESNSEYTFTKNTEIENYPFSCRYYMKTDLIGLISIDEIRQSLREIKTDIPNEFDPDNNYFISTLDSLIDSYPILDNMTHFLRYCKENSSKITENRYRNKLSLFVESFIKRILEIDESFVKKMRAYKSVSIYQYWEYHRREIDQILDKILEEEDYQFRAEEIDLVLKNDEIDDNMPNHLVFYRHTCVKKTPKWYGDKKLNMKAICMLYYYEGWEINKENSDDIANKYGHTSGRKLLIEFGNIPGVSNRYNKFFKDYWKDIHGLLSDNAKKVAVNDFDNYLKYN